MTKNSATEEIAHNSSTTDFESVFTLELNYCKNFPATEKTSRAASHLEDRSEIGDLGQLQQIILTGYEDFVGGQMTATQFFLSSDGTNTAILSFAGSAPLQLSAEANGSFFIVYDPDANTSHGHFHALLPSQLPDLALRLPPGGFMVSRRTAYNAEPLEFAVRVEALARVQCATCFWRLEPYEANLDLHLIKLTWDQRGRPLARGWVWSQLLDTLTTSFYIIKLNSLS